MAASGEFSCPCVGRSEWPLTGPLEQGTGLPRCAALRGYCNGRTTLWSRGIDPMLVLSLIGLPSGLVE